MISSVIPLVEVRKVPCLDWDKEGLSWNYDLSVDDILHLPIKDGKWNWYNISRVIPIIDVYTHPDLKWNRGELSWNKDIRVGDLIAWHEIVPSIYRRWQYPTDVIII